MLMSRSMARTSIKEPLHSESQDFLKQVKPLASCSLFLLESNCVTVKSWPLSNWLHDLEEPVFNKKKKVSKTVFEISIEII